MYKLRKFGDNKTTLNFSWAVQEITAHEIDQSQRVY